MRTYQLMQDKDRIPRTPRAIALGIFDGVHIGHRAVISRAVGMEGTSPAVFTFSQPPWELPKDNAYELLSMENRIIAMESLGVAEMFEADFEQIREMTPEEFVRIVLHEILNARRVCCGFNYRFGKNCAGDAALLTQLCGQYGIETIVIGAILVDGEPVSASRIRRHIEQGEVQDAARLLGRPFTINFEVVGGQHLGRLLGTPTINQPLPDHFVRPRFGVYASSVEVDGKVTHGVTNVGVRPTVGAPAPLAETWIPTFSGNLYGKKVPVSLISFIRPEVKFDNIEELQKQIIRDEKVARRAVMGDAEAGLRAVLFDFDDTLQNRPQAFLQYCDYFLDKYFPSLSPQKHRERAQEMLERNRGGYVNYIDYFMTLIEDWNWTSAPPVGDIYREFQFRFPEYSALFPDTLPVLTELRKRGYLLGIITNGPSVLQNRKLDVSGLRPYVDIAVVSGDELIHKPDPEIFRRTAARLGVACQSCIYVGDHPVNDIQGAQDADMRPVYINAYDRDVHIENVTEIQNLTELLDIV